MFTGGNVIEHERRRIEELRRRAADEGRAQWEERKLREANCKSFNSLESEDSSISSSCETQSEKETRYFMCTLYITITLVNVYITLPVFTHIAGTS